MKLRITNITAGGKELQTVWEFSPLFDTSKKPDRRIVRRSGRAANADAYGKPLAEQEVIRITFGAGLLATTLGWTNFKKFCRAHKIEVGTRVLGKDIWTHYELEADEDIDMDRIEEHQDLPDREFKLIEKNARWYGSWY